VRWRARARFNFFQGLLRVSLDTHDGQNDDRCGFSSAGAAKAHQAPFIRKFYDVTHRLSPSDGRRGSLRFDPLISASSQLGGTQG
jgi:hypothetical protein